MTSVSKTLELRKVIQAKLKTVCTNVYYEQEPPEHMFPHIVWDLSSVNLGDLSRDDLILDIHIWTKEFGGEGADTLADTVEALFNNWNAPQSTILPTFFRSTRKNVEDSDKQIKHRYIAVQVQNYEV